MTRGEWMMGWGYIRPLGRFLRRRLVICAPNRREAGKTKRSKWNKMDKKGGFRFVGWRAKKSSLIYRKRDGDTTSGRKTTSCSLWNRGSVRYSISLTDVINGYSSFFCTVLAAAGWSSCLTLVIWEVRCTVVWPSAATKVRRVRSQVSASREEQCYRVLSVISLQRLRLILDLIFLHFTNCEPVNGVVWGQRGPTSTKSNAMLC